MPLEILKQHVYLGRLVCPWSSSKLERDTNLYEQYIISKALCLSLAKLVKKIPTFYTLSMVASAVQLVYSGVIGLNTLIISNTIPFC